MKIFNIGSLCDITDEERRLLANKNIFVRDNVINWSMSDYMIDKFENDQKHTVHRDIVSPDGNHICFDEINVTTNPDWEEINQVIIHYTQFFVQEYRSSLNIPNYAWPEDFGYEQIRMKRYLPNNKDRFDPHADVRDYASARRFLVMFMYLNTVEEGGETAFYFDDCIIKVAARAGRIIAFPPFWTHPHAGLMPVSNPKYIIGSYLHFL